MRDAQGIIAGQSVNATYPLHTALRVFAQGTEAVLLHNGQGIGKHGRVAHSALICSRLSFACSPNSSPGNTIRCGAGSLYPMG